MYVHEFSELFTQKRGKNKIKITNKDGAKITQQKSKIIPIQLQKMIDAKINDF